MSIRKKPDRAVTRQLVQLFESTERVLSASLCFHDFFQRAGLPAFWQWHHDVACSGFRTTQFAKCAKFDGDTVHRNIVKSPQGLVQCCPFGVREIVIPVFSAEMYVGVLFAGGFNENDSGKKCDDVKKVLVCVAERIGQLLDVTPDSRQEHGRQRQREILTWVEEHLQKQATLADLAKRLCLSPARTSKVVRELFLKSFTELVQTTKLDTAAYWLISSELSAGEIARRLGFYDQACFSRLFSRRFGISPIKYRNLSLENKLGS